MQIEEQVDSRRAVASKAERGGEGGRRYRRGSCTSLRKEKSIVPSVNEIKKKRRRRFVSLGAAEMFVIACVYLRRPFRARHVVCINYMGPNKRTEGLTTGLYNSENS